MKRKRESSRAMRSPGGLPGACSFGIVLSLGLAGCAITGIDTSKESPACCRQLTDLPFHRIEADRMALFTLSGPQSSSFDFGGGDGPVVGLRLPADESKQTLRTWSMQGIGGRFICPTAVFLDAEKRVLAKYRLTLGKLESVAALASGLSASTAIPTGSRYVVVYADPTQYRQVIGTVRGEGVTVTLPGGIHIPGMPFEQDQKCASDGEVAIRVN